MSETEEKRDVTTAPEAEEEKTEEKVFDAKAELKTLPNLPGCYRYFDAEGRCLYVGKARDLKKRSASW